MDPTTSWESEEPTRLETELEGGLTGLMLGLWLGFLFSLMRPSGGLGWFIAVALLHLLPLPIVLFGSETESQQFLGWGSFGGLALILGLPHHIRPAGARAWPRVLTTVAVAVGLGLLYLGRRSLA